MVQFLFAVCAAAVIHLVVIGPYAGYGAYILLLIAGGIFICHADVKSSLLYGLLMMEIMQLCYGMVKSLIGMLHPLIYGVAPETGIAVMLAGELVSLMLAGACYYMIERYFSFYAIDEMQNIYLVFIPILMIFIMDEYINTQIYGWEVIRSDGTAEYLIDHWHMLVLQLLGLASLFCILFAYKKLLQSFCLRTELSLLEQREHSLNQYVEETRSRYEKTKSFRHDIKNHIAVIRDLLQGGKTEAALQYIGEMEDITEELLVPCSTNNPVVDILVGNKLGIAKAMGILASCSLLLPYPCGLRDIDLCIILANALDNAIHACKCMEKDTEAYIHVSGRIQGDFLIIEIENTFQGKEGFQRGTGLSNIKTVAEKYHGTMSIKTQGNVFGLHVLLIIPQHPESIPQQMDESAASSGRNRR